MLTALIEVWQSPHAPETVWTIFDTGVSSKTVSENKINCRTQMLEKSIKCTLNKARQLKT